MKTKHILLFAFIALLIIAFNAYTKKEGFSIRDVDPLSMYRSSIRGLRSNTETFLYNYGPDRIRQRLHKFWSY